MNAKQDVPLSDLCEASATSAGTTLCLISRQGAKGTPMNAEQDVTLSGLSGSDELTTANLSTGEVVIGYLLLVMGELIIPDKKPSNGATRHPAKSRRRTAMSSHKSAAFSMTYVETPIVSTPPPWSGRVVVKSQKPNSNLRIGDWCICYWLIGDSPFLTKSRQQANSNCPLPTKTCQL